VNYKFEYFENVLLLQILTLRATVKISGQLKKELIEIINDENKKIVVDLSQTDFVDSSFLGVLLAGLKKATVHNGDLKISGLRENVRVIFELTKLYRVFGIFNTADEAIKSF